MIRRTDLINLLRNNAYHVECFGHFYIRIQNTTTGTIVLIPYKNFCSWLSLRGHVYAQKEGFKAHWKVTFRMFQLQHEINKQIKNNNYEKQ